MAERKLNLLDRQDLITFGQQLFERRATEFGIQVTDEQRRYAYQLFETLQLFDSKETWFQDMHEKHQDVPDFPEWLDRLIATVVLFNVQSQSQLDLEHDSMRLSNFARDEGDAAAEMSHLADDVLAASCDATGQPLPEQLAQDLADLTNSELDKVHATASYADILLLGTLLAEIGLSASEQAMLATLILWILSLVVTNFSALAKLRKPMEERAHQVKYEFISGK